jgi:hypothetical protein
MHDVALKYRKSTLPIDIFNGTLTANLSMLGTNEGQVSYPTLFTDPIGSLYFMFRDGISYYGDLYFYKYNHATQVWSAAAGTSTAGKLIDGRAQGSGPYWIRPAFDANFGFGGFMHFAWTWCVSSSGLYPNWSYAKWDGTNFYQSDGTAQTMPITLVNDENIDNLGNITSQPTLLHQGCYSDAGGHPHFVYGRDDGGSNYYCYHIWHNGTSWVKLKLFDLLVTNGPQWPIIAIDRESNTCYVIYTNSGDGDSKIRFIKSVPNDFTKWSKPVILWNTDQGDYGVKFDEQEWERNKRLVIPIESWNNSGTPAPILTLTFIPSGWSLSDALNYPGFHANDTDLSPTSIHHTLGTTSNQAATGNHTHIEERHEVVMESGVTPPTPILNSTGDDWVYSS